MPNTTNFNWPTPADTDLVKDGAAAIRNLGNGVDTSLVDLKGGTTGQILSKASNADMDFTWTAGGDLTEVQAGTGISVASGTGPIPVITNTVATAFDAAGDLVYGTGADTFTKLALGTAGQVLKVNSGATAPEWGAAGGAAGLIHINTTTFSAVASQSVNDVFSATYDYYVLFIDATASVAGDDINIRMRVSGSDDTTSNYRGNGLNMLTTGTTVSGTNNNNGTSGFIFESSSADPGSAYVVIMNPFLAKTTQFLVNAFGGNRWWPGGGQHNVATSYTGFTLLNATGGGNTISGTLQVYGYDK